MRAPIQIGAFTITPTATTEHVDGETVTGIASTGRGRFYEITGTGGLHLTVRETTWATGERDVVATRRHDSPQRFDTLIERLRLPVSRRGHDFYAELRQVRLKPNGRGNLFAASEEDLDRGACVSVARQLERHGAGRVGTREELLGDDGRTRNRLGVRFGQHADLVPVIAYVCTRVAPVASGFTA
jgi:hypothetical protein